jgi:hypothetical protein
MVVCFPVFCPHVYCYLLHICPKFCHLICYYIATNSTQFLDNEKCEWADTIGLWWWNDMNDQGQNVWHYESFDQ